MGSIGQPTIGILPWQGHKAVGGTWARDVYSTALLGLGRTYNSTAAQNDYIEWDVWLDSGTWKIALVARKAPDEAIRTFKFNGTTVGTIDGYAASGSDNNYNEITGISVTTPALHTVRVIAESKNASSTGYYMAMQSIALIKTAGAHSTPAGSDTPGYTWIYLPFMGSKANTGWSSLAQASTRLGGGYVNTNTAQNAEISWDIWLDVGTYKYAQVHATDTNNGIYSVQLDAVEKGTIDGYAGVTTENVYSEITGIVVASAGVKTFKVKMATKNASSSAYTGRIVSVAWIRTGA